MSKCRTYKERGPKAAVKMRAGKRLCQNTCVDQLRTKPSKTNKSGVRGVYWDHTQNRWMVYINFKGKRYYLGYFIPDEFDKAVAARKKAEEHIWGNFLVWYAKEYGYETN